MVGLRLQVFRALRGLKKLLLRNKIFAGQALGLGLGALYVLGERVDEALNARDLAGLRRFVVLRPLHVIPGRIVRSERRSDTRDHAGTQRGERNNAHTDRATPTQRSRKLCLFGLGWGAPAVFR